MTKIGIDVLMSLDAFIARRARRQQVFHYYFRGDFPHENLFNRRGDRSVVAEMFQPAGVMLTGRQTYQITNGWTGTHQVYAIPPRS